MFLGSHLSNWHWFTKYLFNLPRVIQDHFQYHSLHPSSGHSLYLKITYYIGRAHLCLLGAIFNCALLQMRGSANSSETLFKLTTLPARSFCFHQSSGQKNIWYRFEIPTPFPFSHFQTFRLQNLPFIYIQPFISNVHFVWESSCRVYAVFYDFPPVGQKSLTKTSQNSLLDV